MNEFIRSDGFAKVVDKPQQRHKGGAGTNEGNERTERNNGASEEGPARRKHPKEARIKLIPFEELRFTGRRRHLIKHWFPRVGIAVVYGPPKCGKSLWMTSTAMHVALGWDYRGHKVQQGSVVYCAFEGQMGFADRLEAFRQEFLKGYSRPIPFFLQPIRLNLVSDHKELITAIAEQLSDAPAMIVLDTLNRSMKGSESSDEDMSAYIAAADALRERFNCVVAIVHHSGLEAGRPRGHTSLVGAVDVQIQVSRDANGHVVARVELMKDGVTDATDVSSLEVVTIGADQDGDEVTSCVLREMEGSSSITTKMKLSGSTKIALDLLKRAIVDAGEIPPASNHIPPKTRTISLSAWRSYCDRGTVANSDKPDSQRKAFVRACKRLQTLGLIGVWGDDVWPVGR